jgi:hypothetical protein
MEDVMIHKQWQFVRMLGVMVMLTAIGVQGAWATSALVVTVQPSPANGMLGFTISAKADPGKKIATILDLVITGPVHQVWQSSLLGGAKTSSYESGFPSGNVLFPQAWAAYDSHLTLTAAQLGGGVGTIGDLSTALVPSGVTLQAIAPFSAQTGWGGFGRYAPGDGIFLVQSAQAQEVPFLYLVIPTDQPVTLTATLLGTGQPANVTLTLPEPGSLALLTVAVAMVGSSRRRKQA